MVAQLPAMKEDHITAPGLTHYRYTSMLLSHLVDFQHIWALADLKCASESFLLEVGDAVNYIHR